jgi:hypothetical protein
MAAATRGGGLVGIVDGRGVRGEAGASRPGFIRSAQ